MEEKRMTCMKRERKGEFSTSPLADRGCAGGSEEERRQSRKKANTDRKKREQRKRRVAKWGDDGRGREGSGVEVWGGNENY